MDETSDNDVSLVGYDTSLMRAITGQTAAKAQ